MSDFGSSEDIKSMLDAIATECGAKPLSQNWNEILPEINHRALKEVFLYGLGFSTESVISETDAEGMAKEFSSHFSETVRYFTNTDSGLVSDFVGYSQLQDVATPDFGLVLVDEKNIGMVMLVGYS